MDGRRVAVITCIFVTYACFAGSPIQQSESDVNAGKALFNDASLSADGRVSCASCHQPQRAFSDGKSVAIGVFGRAGNRNTPSLLNLGASQTFFWDGRRTRLEDAVTDPFFIAQEMGLTHDEELVARVRAAGYANRFNHTFPDTASISVSRIQSALAAYVRSLTSRQTPYQQPRSAWNLQGPAKQGMAIFFGKAQCNTCHTVTATDGRFTDDRFHASALGTQHMATELSSLITTYLAHPATGRQLGELVAQRKDLAELGRFLVSTEPADINTFRTPSLLNVANTAPYMHDGSVATLEQAVDLEIYYRSLQTGKPLHLTVDERSNLVTFLKTLRSP